MTKSQYIQLLPELSSPSHRGKPWKRSVAGGSTWLASFNIYLVPYRGHFIWERSTIDHSHLFVRLSDNIPRGVVS